MNSILTVFIKLLKKVLQGDYLVGRTLFENFMMKMQVLLENEFPAGTLCF